MPKKPTTKKTAPSKYENNPFFIVSSGITLLFNRAQGVAFLLFFLGLFSFISNRGSSDDPKEMWDGVARTVAPWSFTDWSLAIGAGLIIGLAIVMITSLFGGVSSYTSAKLAQGERVKLSEAFRVAFDNLWGYIWLQIIVAVKVILWSLLFIVPGIYMAFRYSLAGVAFFDDRKELRGNAAIQESLRLTKGAWITTFSANLLFDLVTFGFISLIVTTSANTTLYRQFDELGDKPKPEAHWLSWLTLIFPLILFVFALVFLVAIITGLAIGGSVSTSP